MYPAYYVYMTDRQKGGYMDKLKVSMPPLYPAICRQASRNFFFLFLNQHTYVVGTQKNSPNETILLSTQNTCLNL